MPKKILHIVSSTRGADSFSTKAGNLIVEKIRKNEGEASVDVLDLSKLNFPYLSQQQISSFFTQHKFITSKKKAYVKRSDDAIT